MGTWLADNCARATARVKAFLHHRHDNYKWKIFKNETFAYTQNNSSCVTNSAMLKKKLMQIVTDYHRHFDSDNN